MQTKPNKETVLDELRREKLALKKECEAKETELIAYWSYVNENVGSLLLGSLINSACRQLGLMPKNKTPRRASDNSEEEAGSSGSIFHSVWNSLLAISPMLWEMAQPMILSFVMKKVKSIFTSKKKKRRRNDEDDE